MVFVNLGDRPFLVPQDFDRKVMSALVPGRERLWSTASSSLLSFHRRPPCDGALRLAVGSDTHALLVHDEQLLLVGSDGRLRAVDLP